LKAQKGFFSGAIAYLKRVGRDKDVVTLVENMDRLIEGELMAYDLEKKNFRDIYSKKRLNPLFLQGSTSVELGAIINFNKKGQRVDDKRFQYKVYTISDDDLKNSERMRLWCYRLLFSMPNALTVDNSDFAVNMQHPISKFFMTKLGGERFKYGVIKGYLDKINEKAKIDKSQKLSPNMIRAQTLKAVRQGNFVSRDTVLNMCLDIE